MSKDLDLAIIGAGIAGVSAAIYAKRSGLKFKIFEAKAIGGQLFYMEKIDNYAGLDLGASGASFAQKLEANLQGLGISVEKKSVKQVKRQKEGFLLLTASGSVKARAMIIATGAIFKKLGIKDEGKFAGVGVSYCAVCDGFFFKNKDVAVVGGGNTAVEDALYLANLAKSVTLIHRRDKLRALDYLQKSLKSNNKIKIIYNHTVEELRGSQKLESLVLAGKNGKYLELAVQGLFVAVGVTPNTDFCANLCQKDKQGFILTDAQMKTSEDLVWACGDCRRRPLRQLITAASEGAIASLEVYKQIRQSYVSV